MEGIATGHSPSCYGAVGIARRALRWLAQYGPGQDWQVLNPCGCALSQRRLINGRSQKLVLPAQDASDRGRNHDQCDENTRQTLSHLIHCPTPSKRPQDPRPAQDAIGMEDTCVLPGKLSPHYSLFGCISQYYKWQASAPPGRLPSASVSPQVRPWQTKGAGIKACSFHYCVSRPGGLRP